MYRRLTFFAIGAIATLGVVASPISPDQALARLKGNGAMKAKGISQGNLRYLSTIELSGETPMAYAYENASGEGFVLLSADDLAYPVLGYSDSGKLDINNLPPQLVSLLSDYASEIEYARLKGITPSEGNLNPVSASGKERIEPMLKSKWDQGAPYYNDCPTVGSRHCYTGCVATSMAQVMYYFKYPEVGEGSKTLTVNGANYRLNFGDKAFDWANMLDSYVSGAYNDVQAEAVAYLMKACGFSVNMQYGTDASGTTSHYVSAALKNNFKYDPNLTYETRLSYSATEWDNKIYNSLKGGSPVIYNGNDSSIGHSFVCDGYDGNGYYHINWGWSGMADGYFMLNALNPQALGTGGGAGGGYNFLQGAVLNIKKPTGAAVNPQNPTFSVYGLLGVDSMTKDAVGNYVVGVGIKNGYGPFAGWRNDGESTLSCNIGGIFYDASGNVVATSQGKFGGMNNIRLEPGSIYAETVKVTIPVPTLANGDYRMVVATRLNTVQGADWTPVTVPYAYPDYVIIHVENGIVKGESVENPRLKVTDFKMNGKLFYGRGAKVSFTMENTSDYELTEAVTVLLASGVDVKFRSSDVLVTVAPHSTVSQDWTLPLYPQTGQTIVTKDTEFDLYVYNDLTNQSYGNFGKVTMQPNPGDPSISAKNISIPDSESEQVEMLGQKFSILAVKNQDHFDVNLTLRVSRGYFDYDVVADIAELAPNATAPNQTITVKDQIFSEYIELNAGEEKNLTIPVSFPQGKADKIYYIKLKYFTGSAEKSIASIRFKVSGNSGVEIIGVDYEDAEYYNLQGLRVAEPQKGEVMIVKRGSETKKVRF